ncbi:double-stranded RNA-binding protein 8 [Lolium perenne]|uniref:double-stranded RNA-binding protein 8 n=1 Tax=Lolium perenne TaxID=4522 RepID=UPI0021EAE41E|nr:double-stranded RNA-binding protein 8-like [Lolium perenne]
MDGAGMSAPPEHANSSPAPNGSGGGIRVENCYVFKSRLQEYAQKAGLMAPEYQTLKEGPSHEPVFRSTVLINNAKYESLPGFFSRKAAEQSAAEVALMEIGKSAAVATNASIPAVQETGLCKNLLQEYAQKMNYAIPSYICVKQTSGVGSFICTVEIGGIHYIGATARTKKEAEIKAARTALLAIQGQSEGCANGSTKYIVVPGKRQGKEPEKRPIETPKPLKAKKGGFKKQRNKQKFIKNNGQAVNVEKNEELPGDSHQSDVPMEPAETTQDPSIDTVMLQPDEETIRMDHEPMSDTAILQPDVEARKVEQESPSDTAILQAHEEAGRVEHEPPNDTPMFLHNEEARSIKQEPLIDTAMPQPHVEDRSVEPEPPRDAAILQANEEAGRVEQEPPSDTPMVLHNEEARSIKQEPFIDTPMPQPHVEDRSVEPEPPRDAAVVQPNEEPRSVKQEPLIDAAMPQPHVEGRSVEPEPPRDAVMQPNEDPRSVKQEPHIDTAVPLPNEVAKPSVTHVSPNDSTIEQQPNAEARNIKEEPLSNKAVPQHDEETRIVNQEPLSNGS